MPGVQAVLLAALDDWFPFLVYALLAAAIPASMLFVSFALSTRRTQAAAAGPADAVRVGRLDRPAEAAAVHGQLLPDGDALHRLRHRDRLPLSGGGRPRRGRARSRSPSSASSSPSSRSPTSTSGSGVRSSGGEAKAARRLRPPVRADAHAREGPRRLRAGARRGRARGAAAPHHRREGGGLGAGRTRSGRTRSGSPAARSR